MSVLSYHELISLVSSGVINAPVENVNGSSIDITLHNIVQRESEWYSGHEEVDPAKKQFPRFFKSDLDELNILAPGEFLLASSVEYFNLPNNISAEYKLKSTLARCGIEHLNAGWCDPGWNGSRLTLELKNMLRNHNVILTPGMKIGQIVFYKHEEVPGYASYSVRGQYNNQSLATSAKELK